MKHYDACDLTNLRRKKIKSTINYDFQNLIDTVKDNQLVNYIDIVDQSGNCLLSCIAQNDKNKAVKFIHENYNRIKNPYL